MTARSARPDDSARSALLRARTTVPRPSPRTFARPRLLRQLDLGTAGPVTLVSGGPGCGKTQLVSQWAQLRDGPGTTVGWLALGADGNDPQRLWSLLLSALLRGVPASDPLRSLRAPADIDQSFLTQVTIGLNALPRPFVLVLEDVHEVRSRAALASLDQLIATMPAQLRLVIVTRADPALALHRLRVAGELTEIRQAALAFTNAEAVELFAQHRLDLTEAEVEQLLARTEGWAAGLRLAALSLQGRADPLDRTAAIAHFAGDNRAVVDYLMAEVLARQPAPLRRFLLLTSVVERIDAGLADALTGGRDGARSLDALERAGALVVALDGARDWYRYHRLLIEMCRHRLAVETPEQVAVLHSRAARWFASHHEPVEAVRHAMEARDWPFLGQTVVRQAGALVFGHQGRAMRDLLRDLPEEAVAGDAWLACAGALAWHDEADRPELERQLARVELLLSGTDAHESRPVGMVLALLRSAAAREQYDLVAATAHSARALELAAGISSMEVPALPQYVAFAHVLRGASLTWQGKLIAAESHLRQATIPRPVPGVPDWEDAVVLARAYLSLVLAMQGSSLEAHVQAEAALDIADRAGWTDDVQSAAAHLALVLVHWQQADRLGCEVALRQASRLLERKPDRLLDVSRRLAEVRLLIDDAALGPAGTAISEVRRLVAKLPQIDFLTRWLSLVQAEADLAAGHHEQVLLALRDSAGGGDGQSTYAGILCGRALLGLGRPQGALDAVAPVIAGPTTGIRAVEAWLVTAEAQDGLRRDGAALSALDRALECAAPEQILRPFSSAVPRLGPLLQRYRTVAGRYAATVDRILAVEPALPVTLPDPLTDRELSVLQLLPTMMSNSEIASELFVSVNTVKAHLKSLYRKLGATTRREAVLRGAHLVPTGLELEPKPRSVTHPG
ncbi:MAG TPA: LuxR C-terminal-related transcriptional regulator [Kribbella sp.]|nr:LuxR C-terminal-related transcriptional regulator [Kribbella sp.]